MEAVRSISIATAGDSYRKAGRLISETAGGNYFFCPILQLLAPPPLAFLITKKLNPAKKMNLANYIDHTILRADCRLQDVETLCKEAVFHGYAAVCVPPFYVAQAAALLEGEKVKVSTVAGFPMGYNSTPAKVEEIKRAIDDGADEIDAVINFCAVKNNNWNFVSNDIDSMITAAHLKGKAIKVIFEMGLLTEQEAGRLCRIALDAQADFLKACTGFNGQEATLEAVQLLRRLAGEKARIATFGGIHSKEDAKRFVEAGVHRVGILAGIAVVG